MTSSSYEVSHFSARQAALFGLGLGYGLLCLGVMYMGARKGLGTISHRFHYGQILVLALIVRALCFGISIAVVEEIKSTSWLNFFLFDVGTLIVMVSIIALIGSQVRNVRATQLLRQAGIIESPKHDNQLRQSLLEDGERRFSEASEGRPLDRLQYHRVSVMIFSGASALIGTYMGLLLILFNTSNSESIHKKGLSFFFIVTNVLLIVALTYSTQREYYSGALSISYKNQPVGLSNNRSKSVNSVSNRKLTKHGKSKLAWHQGYAGKQLCLSAILVLFCAYRILWAAIVLTSGWKSKMEEPFWCLLVDHGVELLFLLLIFFYLSQIAHSCFDVKDSFYTLTMYRKINTPNVNFTVSDQGWIEVEFKGSTASVNQPGESAQESSSYTQGMTKQRALEMQDSDEKEAHNGTSEDYRLGTRPEERKQQLSAAVVHRLMHMMHCVVDEKVDEKMHKFSMQFDQRVDELDTQMMGLRYAMDPNAEDEVLVLST